MKIRLLALLPLAGCSYIAGPDAKRCPARRETGHYIVGDTSLRVDSLFVRISVESRGCRF
jgi:hypothetical protein